MRPTLQLDRCRGAFTLIELLVVIVIIGLISAAALPVILPALNERRVSEAARLVQATLAGARDAAIRANAPRGVRLLPDPSYSFMASVAGGVQNSTTSIPGQPFAANRFIPIEPAPDYSEGTVNGWMDPLNNYTVTGIYYPPGLTDSNGNKALYLRVQSNEATPTTVNVPDPNNPGKTIPTTVYVSQIPTGWQFNIRQGDKIRFNDSGAYYTVAGPIHGQNVFNNPERYICYKPQQTELNTHGDPYSNVFTGQPLDYLNLTNGVDDNGNGWIDESCDGIDNDNDGLIDPGYNGIDDNNDGNIDEPAELLIYRNPDGSINATAGTEYEVEAYLGTQSSSPPSNTDYTISRLPVVSPNAIETTLPEGTVIDLTTWNAAASTPKGYPTFLPERSRLPVNPFSGFVDIMIDQTGRVVPPGAGSGIGIYNSNSPIASLPFYHFWITEREGLIAPLYQMFSTSAQTANNLIPNPNPYYNASQPQTYLLPMPQGIKTVDYNGNVVNLKGQRRMITLFTKTGQIVANTIESFSLYDTSAPYYDAQNGTKESL